ncbi:MAG: hypothetical protein ACUVSA_11020 [Desulfosoma sp.]|uniref:hypothetical protein n=1 Tax=Desulfosoma sp. TaxID=2603217 RepID=UPI00404A7243
MKAQQMSCFLSVVVLTIVSAFLSAPAAGAENNAYRAGYVRGFRDAPIWKAKDPSITAGRYAETTRDALAAQGPVPRNFWRGLRDGYRDAVRAYTPKFTEEDVNRENLPSHLRP